MTNNTSNSHHVCTTPIQLLYISHHKRTLFCQSLQTHHNMYPKPISMHAPSPYDQPHNTFIDHRERGCRCDQHQNRSYGTGHYKNNIYGGGYNVYSISRYDWMCQNKTNTCQSNMTDPIKWHASWLHFYSCGFDVDHKGSPCPQPKPITNSILWGN